MGIIVIQRGHVGRTTGATGAPGEQRFATSAARRCEVHLRALGHSVRVIDADPASTSHYAGDLFVALHWDSSTSASASGASVGWQTGEGQHFGARWKHHYRANGWDRGFRDDNYTPALAGYYGVRRAVAVGTKTAVILEAGFQSNAGDMQLLAEPQGPDRVGRAVAAAVVDLWGCRCPAGTPPGQPPSPPWAPPYPGTVRRGAVGGAVRVWQEGLRRRSYDIAADGVFGPATDNAVRSWQSRCGLVVDGIAGPATWHQLVYR